jgi:hypothetical protein
MKGPPDWHTVSRAIERAGAKAKAERRYQAVYRRGGHVGTMALADYKAKGLSDTGGRLVCTIGW